MIEDDDGNRPFKDQGRMTHERFERAARRYRDEVPWMASRLDAPEPPPAQPRPGVVSMLTCEACGLQAGFRVVGDFLPVRTRVMARKAGWTAVHRSDPVGTCPACNPEGAA